MSTYRKVDTRIWNDQKFRELSDSGKLGFFLLLTHPHMTSLGAMRATPGGLADELGWTPEAFREAFQEALSKGLAKHDAKACCIWLPNFLKYNGPESPNVVKSWGKALDLIPECQLKNQCVQQVKGFVEGLSKAFSEALPEVFRKTMPNQEQEQEQEQNKKQEGVSTKRKPKFAYFTWIKSEDLSNPAKMLDWHSRVAKVNNSPVQDSDGSRINVLAAAAMALDGKADSMAWFVSCVQSGFEFVNQAAEDAASKTFKKLRGNSANELFGNLVESTKLPVMVPPDDEDEPYDDGEGDQ